MRICLYLDKSRKFRWHLWLIEELICSHEVVVHFSPNTRPLPKSCLILLRLEHRIYPRGRQKTTAIDQIDSPLFASEPLREPFDAVIDLAADGTPLPACENVLTLHFNSFSGEIGAIEALLGNQPLSVEVHRNSAIWTARPATANRNVLIRGLDALFSCGAVLLAKACKQPPVDTKAAILSTTVHSNEKKVMRPLLSHMSDILLRKIGERLAELAEGHRRWVVGWRYDNLSLLDRGKSFFHVVPDDGRHFYADPFPMRHANGDFLFVEDYVYATGRGCIAVARLDSGAACTPRPVIETDHHMSYPFVFEYDGQFWMIPETGDIGDICLYRAVTFPYKWVCEGTLMRNVTGYDTTLFISFPFQRIWMFLSEKLWNSTGWDSLSLMYAETLSDNWQRHEANPVVLDASWSRPAGSIFTRKGQSIRPAQDCSQTYGGAIELCRIDVLQPDRFAQTPIGTIRCQSRHGSDYHGCHTYNYHKGLEVIDTFDRAIDNEIMASFMPAFVRNSVAD